MNINIYFEELLQNVLQQELLYESVNFVSCEAASRTLCHYAYISFSSIFFFLMWHGHLIILTSI